MSAACPRCGSHRIEQLSLRQWRCNGCEKRWSTREPTTVTAVRVPCNLYICENQQRETGETLCAALNLASCAKK